jgi:hypothetical protein
MSAPTIILMNGNPRAGKTTTGSILDHLDRCLRDRSIEPIRTGLRAIKKDPDEASRLLEGLQAGATLVVAFPIFLDTPPAQLLEFMARVADARQGEEPAGRLIAIVGSGYPEPIQRRHAREACALFAEEAGLAWGGAIDFGGTPVLGGKPLEELGWMTRHMRRALEGLAADLIEGGDVSASTEGAARRHKLPFPAFMAPWLMNVVMRKRYREASIEDPRARPYAPQAQEK